MLAKEKEEDEYSHKLVYISQMLEHRKEVKILTHILELLSSEKVCRIHQLVAPPLTQHIPILPNVFSKCIRLEYFLKNWANSTSNPTNLETVQGYNILSTVQQEKLKAPTVTIISQEETDFIDQEIRETLNKDAIPVVGNLTRR